MTSCLGKSCSFRFPCAYFVNVCVYMLISLSVFMVGCKTRSKQDAGRGQRDKTNRIYHWSLEKKKKQLVGKRTMSETRCTELPALSIDSMVGISRSMFDYFSYL